MPRIYRWVSNLNLWSQMALAISLGFLLLFAAFLVLGERALLDSADRIRAERLVIAQMAASQVDGLLREAVGELEQASRLTGLNPTNLDGSAQSSALARIADLADDLDAGVILLNSRGQVILSRPAGLYPPETDLSGLPYIAQALARREPTISQPFRASLNNRPVVAITIPLYNNGRLTGLLSGLMDLQGYDILKPLHRAATFGHTGHAALVDSRGRVLAGTLDLPFLSPGEHLDFYRQAIAGGQPVVDTVPFELVDIPGETYGEHHVMAFVPLAYAPWGVAVGGDEDDTFAGVWRLRFGLALISTLALVSAWLATLVGTRRLVRPIQHLTGAAQRIAGGDLHTPLQVSGSGEITAMAAALERMRRQLLANINELTNWNKTLAIRVAEQTKELHQHQTMLSGLDQAVRASLALDEMLEQILTQTRQASQVAQGALFLYNEETQNLYPAVIQGPSPGQLEDLQKLALQAINRRKLLLVSKPGPQDHPVKAETDRASILAIPLTLDQAILGAFVLADHQPQAFSPRQVTLLSTIASQTALIVRNSQLYAQLEGQAILEERSWLAREIHDSVVQTLGYLKMQVKRMQGWVQAGDLARLDREITDLGVVIQEAYREARDAIAGLRVGLDPGDTLESVLAEYVPGFSARYQLPVALVVEGNTANLQPTVILHLLRIVQEGLTNVRKHAGATQAGVEVRYQPDELVVSITDDGHGLDPQIIGQAGLRGMQFMRERAEGLGGQLAIFPRQPRGTEVRVTIKAPNLSRPGSKPKSNGEPVVSPMLGGRISTIPPATQDFSGEGSQV